MRNLDACIASALQLGTASPFLSSSRKASPRCPINRRSAGGLPGHAANTGCFLIVGVFGARKMIFVKDEDRLYTATPKKDPAARYSSSCSAHAHSRNQVRKWAQTRAIEQSVCWRASPQHHLQFRSSYWNSTRHGCGKDAVLRSAVHRRTE